MDEKRRCHRMTMEIPMNFRVPPDNKLNITTTLNIGATGIAFASNSEVKVGCKVFMYLLLPEGDEIELQAEVVWVKEEEPEDIEDQLSRYKIGVRILEPVEFDEKKFIKFYSEKLSEMFKQK